MKKKVPDVVVRDVKWFPWCGSAHVIFDPSSSALQLVNALKFEFKVSSLFRRSCGNRDIFDRPTGTHLRTCPMAVPRTEGICGLIVTILIFPKRLSIVYPSCWMPNGLSGL